MSKNILLLFLSDVKRNSDGIVSEKVFNNVDGEPSLTTSE